MSRFFARIRFSLTYSLSRWRQHPVQFLLAIFGIALAVLAITLLAGAGLGVIDTGEQQFEQADRDLWLSSGETGLAPITGGFSNTIDDSRNLSAELEQRDDIRHAFPLSFENIYASDSPDQDAFQSVIGVGSPGGSPVVQVTEGDDLSGDPYYANGTYSGNRTNEVLLDEETADDLDVSVGDTLYVEQSRFASLDNNATVVGISPTYQQLLGAPTVVMPLSEFHETTNSQHLEPATFITITVTDGADPEVVQSELQSEYPEYAVRTDQEQMEAILEDQMLVLSAGGAIVILAFLGGTALTFTLLSVVIYQQRRPIAALQAQGVSARMISIVAIIQGALIGVVGGLLGVLLTAPSVMALNNLATRVVGFDGLVQTAPEIYLAGFGLAILTGIIGATIAGFRVGRTPILDRL